jgi:hypothetical protein
MRVQIRTLQIPGSKNAGAFMPQLTPLPTAATNGQNLVTGAPGTVPVRSPRPAALSDGELGGPLNQPSSCAPDFILPSVYVAHENPTLRFPGRIQCDNVLPVPAEVPTGVPAQTQYRVRVGGRTATPNYRPWTTWPTYGGGSQ